MMTGQIKNDDNKRRIWTMIKILLILFIFSTLIAVFFDTDDELVVGYNTAIIPIKGTITAERSPGFFDSETASSSDIINTIRKVKDDSNIKAVIFEINSPGGSPVATEEISKEILSLKEQNITTVAWIRETGASGAYWIASSTDHIIANKMSVVGSIGVYGSYLEFYGLLNRYNITYQRLVSGEYKDAGTPYRPLSSIEENMIQEKLDKIHEYFIKAVAENRNMDYDDVEKLATGEIFLGVEAKENGLIDELGGETEVKKYVENKLNKTIVTKTFARDKTFVENLMTAMNKNSYYIGKGISSGIIGENNIKITT
ncbi:MAG: signal peptide peptidase SppA [Candidatus Woesearchaeota archaeon]